MSKKIYSEEIPEDIRKEISFLHKIGVGVEELDFLITAKLRNS